MMKITWCKSRTKRFEILCGSDMLDGSDVLDSGEGINRGRFLVFFFFVILKAIIVLINGMMITSDPMYLFFLLRPKTNKKFGTSVHLIFWRSFHTQFANWKVTNDIFFILYILLQRECALVSCAWFHHYNNNNNKFLFKSRKLWAHPPNYVRRLLLIKPNI